MKIQKQPDYLIFADSAKKGENAEFPDISRGWGVTIEQTASKPPMEWMNGAFNRVDKNMLYLLQQGIPEWSDKVTYPVNAIIKYNGVLYTAITENDNTKPSANTTKWKKTQAEIPTASTDQKGIVKLNSAVDSNSETTAATSLAVKKTYDLVSLINDTFKPLDFESVVFSPDKMYHAVVRNDGVLGFFNSKTDKIVWAINPSGELIAGSISTNKIKNLDEFIQSKLSSLIDSDSETTAATSLAVKKVNDSAVKKSGDTMTGNIIINNGDSSAVLLRNKKNEEYMLRIHADGSFSIVNKKDGKWTSKFRNEATTNTWRFENTADVTISGKSVLKAGDYGVGAQTGTAAQNIEEHLNSGFYGTNTGKIPNLPFSGGGSAASLLVLPSESPHWKVEQLSVVNGQIPKIYYRTDTKNDGKQNWYEAITTANINQFLPAGIPLPWPTVTPPPNFLVCNGWKFDKSLYPELAAAYPSGYLPELRATTIRGLDAGRGIDVDRVILSEQGDAMRNITGTFGFESNIGGKSGAPDVSGVFYSVPDPSRKHLAANTGGDNTTVVFDASRQVPIAHEFRVRNTAYLYIVRAA